MFVSIPVFAEWEMQEFMIYIDWPRGVMMLRQQQKCLLKTTLTPLPGGRINLNYAVNTV